MDINNLIIESSARHISGRCRLSGTEVPFVSFSVEDVGFRGASTFDLVLASSALPANMQMLNWWATQTTITVELYASIITLSGTDEKKLIIGNIDSWHYDPARFEILADGRDFTALMIDAKSAGESFKNYTSSQIATMLAQRHGLKPVVTATTQRIGEFFKIDSTHLTGEQTEWDLITTLAAIENYSVYIDGENLHFEPIKDSSKEDNYVIRWQPPGSLAYPQCNMSDDLSFSRALTISKGVTVEILSWNAKRKNKQFVASYPKYAKGSTPGNSNSKTQVYRVIRNGLSPEDANELAQTIYQQVVQHEMKFSGSTAGDNLLTPHTLVRVEGTQSPFDQRYWCDSVRRSMSWENGYTMSVSGKNHSPALEVTQ
ncbi:MULTISPECIES: type IV secretion protein Rhs [unclassified Pantoea]|uniref:type IV secretion protein Rhs n=1 Tax=unclassified Pantoea TaxID=2630326 RepID=UPI001CD5E12C|nr:MULTISPECIES: type IV secretion protein Rhs [unclassified Pantoea]MCA1179778.1 type IV secretion protein Rhs [Pantoea sp. alder69]MCA1253620.1 type IV secretion protein Rhs [Pantoea sp. alder70]MCA1268264.1 type IV secretion protein Rhs [Pantoea sp. alder81]